MFRNRWLVAVLGSIVGTFSWSNLASADSPLEGHANRLEDKTDSLLDVIDDNFERVPDYCQLKDVAERLEHSADDLEDAIDDRDWHCSLRLVESMHRDVHYLEEGIRAQPTHCVHRRDLYRAISLVDQVKDILHCMEADLQPICTPVVTLPHRGVITRPFVPVQPILHDDHHHGVQKPRFGGRNRGPSLQFGNFRINLSR